MIWIWIMYLEKSKEIKQNWAVPEKFDICFCVIFDRKNQSFVSEKEAKY